MLIVSVWLILRSNPFYEPKADSPARSTTESTAALKSTKRCAPLPPSAPSVTPAGPAVPSDPKPAVPDKVSITCPALGPRALVSSSPKVKSLPHSRVTLVFVFFSFPVQNGPLCLIHSAIFFFLTPIPLSLFPSLRLQLPFSSCSYSSSFSFTPLPTSLSVPSSLHPSILLFRVCRLHTPFEYRHALCSLCMRDESARLMLWCL